VQWAACEDANYGVRVGVVSVAELTPSDAVVDVNRKPVLCRAGPSTADRAPKA